MRDVRHFLQRGCDKPGQPDDVGRLVARRVENLLGGHHDAKVDHLEVVALEDDPDNVFADVVHVAFHGRHDDGALRLAGVARFCFLSLDVRYEMCDRLLHHPCALDDLRQEHLAGPEQVADDVHARHQRALDHLDRPCVPVACLFGVVDDIGRNTLHQRVRQPFLYGAAAPGEILLGLAPLRLVGLREGNQPLRGVARRSSTTSSTRSRNSGSSSS